MVRFGLLCWLAACGQALSEPSIKRPNLQCCDLANEAVRSGLAPKHGKAGLVAQDGHLELRSNSHTREPCRIIPASELEVSRLLKTMYQHRCSYSVYSALSPSDLDQDGEVILDMSYFNHIQLSEDRTEAHLGVAALWRDVYQTLESHGLAVAGPLVDRVSVGHSVKMGNAISPSIQGNPVVTNIEGLIVAAANGEILRLDLRKHTSNKKWLDETRKPPGVLLGVQMSTFKINEMHGGLSVNLADALDDALLGLTDFMRHTSESKKAVPSQAVVNFVLTRRDALLKTFLISPGQQAFPQSLKNLASLSPKLHETLRTTSLSDLVREYSESQAVPTGSMQSATTLILKNDYELLSTAIEKARSLFKDALRNSGAEAYVSILLEPVSKSLDSAECERIGMASCTRTLSYAAFHLQTVWQASHSTGLEQATVEYKAWLRNLAQM